MQGSIFYGSVKEKGISDHGKSSLLYQTEVECVMCASVELVSSSLEILWWEYTRNTTHDVLTQYV